MRGLIILAIIFLATTQVRAMGRLTPNDSIKRPITKGRTEADTLGRFLRINRIFIIGNRITKESIILRELSFKTGDIVYSEDLPGILEVDKKKLINTRLFNQVDIRTLELQPDKIDLLIDINERWYTFPTVIFELADRNFNEWWENYNRDFNRVNYGVRLYQYNMRGRNETLRFTAQLGFQRKLVYPIAYLISIENKNKDWLSISIMPKRKI